VRATLEDIAGADGLFTDGDWVESKDQDANGDVRLVQLADVGEGSFIDKSSRYLTAAKAKELRCTYLAAGDILIARMPDPIGRACVFPGLSQPSVTVVDVCILRPDPKRVCTRWLLHKINSADFRNAISSWLTGTTRQRISRGNLRNIEFMLPPLDEQRRIAAILDKADALRRKRKRALNLLEEVSGALVAKYLNIGEQIESTIELGEAITDGPTNGLYKPSTDYGDGVPILRINNFYNGRIIDIASLKRLRVSEAEKTRFQLHVGDIVINRVNSLEYLGKSAIVQTLAEPTVFESNMMRFSINSSIMLPRVCIALLQTAGIKQQILSKAKNAVNQSSINQSDVKALRLPLPAMADQRKFVASAKLVEVVKAKVIGGEISLGSLFSSLQHRAFSGQL
jgi:type I restriction enzyme S subunit